MDKTVFDLISEERARQMRGIELIASENFVSDQVILPSSFNLTVISIGVSSMLTLKLHMVFLKLTTTPFAMVKFPLKSAFLSILYVWVLVAFAVPVSL